MRWHDLQSLALIDILPSDDLVLAIVAAETAVPVFVTDEIRMGAPIEFLFREKVGAIDCLRLIDKTGSAWAGLG